jgi:hypothetical protein
VDTTTIIAIVVIAAVAVLLTGAVTVLLKRHKTNEMQGRYGAEYEREVKLHGRRKAVAELSRREQRVSSYTIRTLEPAECADFTQRWQQVQAEFVDAPRTAVQHGDVLLQEVMVARGYPMADFDQRAADLSVEYGAMVRNYRSAQSIAQRAGTATTEDLRRAMLQYRAMFDRLLKVEEPVAV